jgi:hypothetical protein
MEKRVIESYDIANSNETMHLAQDLAKFIKENRLFHNIQGKAYVNVEGWQYAGARLGILPIVEALNRIEEENGELKYQAEVKLMNLRTQQMIGSGFAICSNKEFGKKSYQEFAIASMAQTRAIGKAYRNILAWIIRAAGYEPTPAEEMDYMSKEDEVPVAQQANTQKEVPQGKSQTPKKESTDLKKGGETAKNEESAAKPVQSPAAAAQPEVKAASVRQKTELLLLLNNKAISNEEKNKMLENINSMDSERIEKAIQNIKKVIDQRLHSKKRSAAA